MGDGWPERHAVVDLDQNGTPDIVTVDHFNGSIVWFEIDGTPGGGVWNAHDLSTDMPSAYDVAVTDIDGDGDVVMAAYRSNGYPKWPGEIAWYENRPGGRFRKHRVAGAYLGAFEAVSGDLDADGDLDVVATAWGDGNLAWWENLGNDRRWRLRELAPGFIRGNSVLVRDLDGDGRLDIVACAEIGNNTLRWWRNEGPPL
jgi:hypothetical protein